MRKFCVSPNQSNLQKSVVKYKQVEIDQHLECLIDLIKEKGTNTPKTIVFCNGTWTDIGAIFNHLLL